jgi:NAD(P)-dependent dehydrogenase (short-subunit alcohol dehydrogenase family)
VTKDPVALVIGDTSGLGLVVKEALQKSGWRVYGASRANNVDVRDFAAVARRMDEVERDAGKIDVVANFAGVLHVGSLHSTEPQALDETIAVNLVGSINVARASFHHLRKTKGQLILCSSSSYFRGRKDTAAYSASKAAVVNLTQALAEEWGEHQIAVSCIVPRRANTPMRRKAFPNEDPALCMRPENVAIATEELLKRRQSGLIKHVY